MSIPHHSQQPPLQAGEAAHAGPEASGASGSDREQSRSEAVAHIALSFPCPVCGERYDVTLGQILVSQADMAAGCHARGGDECPSMHFASLVDRRDIEELDRALAKIESAVTAAGGRISLTGHPVE